MRAMERHVTSITSEDPSTRIVIVSDGIVSQRTRIERKHKMHRMLWTYGILHTFTSFLVDLRILSKTITTIFVLRSKRCV